jgi:hypothetical protein
VPTPADHAAANRELSARITRWTWISRIVSIVLGIAVAATVFVLVADLVTSGRRRGGRVSGSLLLIGAVAGFFAPFLGARAVFKWILARRRSRWIAELAEKHGVDPERLRKTADALSDMP